MTNTIEAGGDPFIAALADEHRVAVQERQTIAAARTALIVQALTLADTLTAAARRYDDDLTEALRRLAVPLTTCSAREERGEPTEWRRDIAPLVEAITDTATLFRAEYSALVDLTAHYVSAVGSVAQVTQAEVEARAAELVAERTAALATEAAAYPTH